jgi:hypothetical protein
MLYRVVRVRPNGSEQVVRDIDVGDVSQEQLVRAEAFADARTRKQSGLHIRVYSSQDDNTFGPGDVIWDSQGNL